MWTGVLGMMSVSLMRMERIKETKKINKKVRQSNQNEEDGQECWSVE